MVAPLRNLFARTRGEAGFGMVELLCAMSMMAIGILALFAMFDSGMRQIRRAGDVATASALADSEMERFRAVKYAVIGLDDADAAAADGVYKGDSAFRSEATPTTTLSVPVTDVNATTVTVTPASGFPTVPPFRIKVDNEIMLVEEIVATTIWAVERARDGTAAAPHAAGATVVLKQRAHLPKCGTSPCTTYVPTQNLTGADKKSYRMDTYITWQTITGSDPDGGGPQPAATGRQAKLITLVVRNPTTLRVQARISSSFDESTGL